MELQATVAAFSCVLQVGNCVNDCLKKPAYCKLKKIWNASRICVSSLRRGHANLLCIVPILVYVLPKQVHQPAPGGPYISIWARRDQNSRCLPLFFTFHASHGRKTAKRRRFSHLKTAKAYPLLNKHMPTSAPAISAKIKLKNMKI